jgi:hypothetical protein
LVDFFPPGDGIAGVCFFPPVVDFLAAETLPTADFWGVSFLDDGLLGVYFKTLSTLFLTSADSAAFLPAAFLSLAADFDPAFFFPLAPPLTFGCPEAAS